VSAGVQARHVSLGFERALLALLILFHLLFH
jgi:hypothetical protein